MKFTRFLILFNVVLLSGCQVLHATDAPEKFTASGYPLPYGAKPPATPNTGASPGVNGTQNSIDEDYLIPPPRKPQAAATGKETSALVANVSQAKLTANIAVETDYELFVLLGSSEDNVRAYVANLFDAISNVYRRDANIEIKPSFVRVWTNPNNPWTATTSFAALSELRAYWSSYPETTRSRAVVVFLSGKNLGGGVAYLGSICQKTGAYDTVVVGNLTGLVNNTAGPSTWDVVATAHELGHTFGTGHTHCSQNSAGTGFYDQCYGGEPSDNLRNPPKSCYAGTSVNTYGTIMSYCHVNSTPEVGMRNINPLSFLNSEDDPKIKNVIRTTAEKYTVGNDIEGCLAPTWPLNPTFMVPIINLLTD
jgi:Metallo-peptidase family M12